MRSKKGMVFILLLSLFMIGMIFPSLFITLDNMKGDFSAKIGELQFEILDISSKQQQSLFYIDHAAKFSSYQALSLLEERGGYYQTFPCGSVEYVLWQTKDSICFPEQNILFKNLHQALLPLLKSNLDKAGLDIDYEFYSRENRGLQIIGIALQNLVQPIEFKNDKIGNLTLKPSFDLTLAYDTSIYDTLWQEFSQIFSDVVDCERSAQLSSCVTKAVDDFNKRQIILLEIDCEKKDNDDDRTFLFCASTNNHYLIPQGKGLSEKQQKVKFAVYFRDTAPQLGGLVVEIASKLDKGVILSWKADDKDIDHFNIEFDSTSLSASIKDAQPYVKEMKSFFLYSDSLYHYLIPNLEDKEYTFTITGVDKNSNMADPLTRTFTPQDRLAPPAATNLQLTVSDITMDLAEENLDVYYYIKEGDCTDVVTMDGEGVLGGQRREKNDVLGLFMPGKTYCVAVLVADKAGNPVEKDQKEGITILRVRPEYRNEFPILYAIATITIP
ncbi:hypothetical protein GOV09_02460 [Candidatus Woesearchaeota archaeon]|nr:hypothetical protein [Candidatus Woesearchaeota archaeon]